MDTKEKYTISEATKLLGFKSRSTINKRTKTKGLDSISCDVDENGSKVISIVELQRVFPDRLKTALNKKEDTSNTITEHSTKTQKNTPKNTVNTMWLEQKLELIEQQLVSEQSERSRERHESQEREKKSEEREEHLRSQVNELVKTISQQTRLLENHQKPSSEEINIKNETTPSKLLKETSKELVNVFKFAGFASIAVLVLVIVIYFLQATDHKGIENKKEGNRRALTKKEVLLNKALKAKYLNNNYKNYTPIPE